MYARRAGLGDALDTYADGDTLSNAYAGDPALAQLHQLALLIVALRQQYDTVFAQIGDASVDVDPNTLAVIAGQIQQYVAQFAQLRGSVNATTTATYDLSPVDNAILSVAGWADGAASAVKSVAGAVVSLPTTAANYLADQLSAIAAAAARAAGNASKSAFGALLPIALGVGALALGAIYLTRQAETTRTGRALVRHV